MIALTGDLELFARGRRAQRIDTRILAAQSSRTKAKSALTRLDPDFRRDLKSEIEDEILDWMASRYDAGEKLTAPTLDALKEYFHLRGDDPHAIDALTADLTFAGLVDLVRRRHAVRDRIKTIPISEERFNAWATRREGELEIGRDVLKHRLLQGESVYFVAPDDEGQRRLIQGIVHTLTPTANGFRYTFDLHTGKVDPDESEGYYHGYYESPTLRPRPQGKIRGEVDVYNRARTQGVQDRENFRPFGQSFLGSQHDEQPYSVWNNAFWKQIRQIFNDEVRSLKLDGYHEHDLLHRTLGSFYAGRVVRTIYQHLVEQKRPLHPAEVRALVHDTIAEALDPDRLEREPVLPERAGTEDAFTTELRRRLPEMWDYLVRVRQAVRASRRRDAGDVGLAKFYRELDSWIYSLKKLYSSTVGAKYYPQNAQAPWEWIIRLRDELNIARNPMSTSSDTKQDVLTALDNVALHLRELIRLMPESVRRAHDAEV